MNIGQNFLLKCRNSSLVELSIVSALVILLLFSACGPSLQGNFDVPKIEVAAKTNRAAGSRADVFVDSIIDTRSDQVLVEFEGRDIMPSGSVADAVAKGLKSALKDNGFMISEVAPTILAGEVRTWKASVESGFSGKVKASAEVFVEVLDPANKRVYSGVYQGFSEIKNPGLDRSDIREALRTSMNEAVGQVIADAQLIRLLDSF